ncbi:MAG: hypothetical protein CMF96_03465 [Candidatus Marinimicrobia bacterium]|nr:hypothetical protein [Candidatus Neomarinimicrobiota bacterium]
MNFNKLNNKIFICLFFLIFYSCNWTNMYESSNWEEVNEPHSSKLNIKAIIVLDSLLNYDEDNMDNCDYDYHGDIINLCQIKDEIYFEHGLSSVQIYSTMGLNEISATVSDTMPEWYDCIASAEQDWDNQWCNQQFFIYQPESIVKDANVIVKDVDSGIEYIFNYIETEYVYVNTEFFADSLNIDVHHYKDTSGNFIPKSNTTYSLFISHNDYDDINGEITTPNIPYISMELADTLSVGEVYTINWNPIENQGIIEGYIDGYKFHNFEESKRFCGGRFYSEINLQDSSYIVFPDFIETEDDYCSDEPTDLLINLISMDHNYYEYFVIGNGLKFENFLLEGAGTSGQSIGIDGGYGIFGSYGSNKLFRIILPQNYLE